MRIRQIALVARDLESVVEQIRTVFGIEAPFRDPGVAEFGLQNAVFAIGDTFLEVVSPVREGTTAGRLLERRGGDGGYMVIVQTDDLAADRARVARLGVRVVWEVELEGAATVHLHPRDVGSAIVSIDAMEPPESWRWAGPGWEDAVRTERVAEIAGVELQCDAPDKTARRWSEVLGVAEPERVEGLPEIGIGASRARFAPASDRGEGVSAVWLRATDPARVLETARECGLAVDRDSIELCGTRFRLV